ncbi:hypothetical protein Noda2021_08000 [Candidatus Dependentiae bacterium Noda2021]|nr:hypothetical protein Noda2021_08000 [Candidatus Dependentiae bacterium Noda2021]
MKKLIMVVSIISGSLYANSQELFLRANKLYETKNYHQALELYEQIENKGAAVWHNMGNCSYCLQQNAQALLYWRRAQKNAPKAIVDSAQQAIEKVNTLLEINAQDSSKERIERSIKNIPLILLQLLFLLSWCVLMGLFIWSYCSKTYRLLILALFNVILVGSLNYKKYTLDDSLSAIVCADEACVRVGPGTEYPVIASLKKGTELKIHNKQKEWCKVRFENLTGWAEHNEAVSIV